ncbi:MAG: NAD(P)-dependent alcohol dehydrogenase [Cyanobacteria bacterium P01_H01_bin.74]
MTTDLSAHPGKVLDLANRTRVNAFGVQSAGESVQPLAITRRPLNLDDVQIEIEYCGICHSDIHMVNNDWGMSIYPMVPGHEIVGRVLAVGNAVTKFKVGDSVGVGCLVDACGDCPSCANHLEQYCLNGFTLTYGSETPADGITYGGYSTQIVVKESFVLRVPESLDRQSVAPLLCAGITTYSPLKHWNIQPGDVVGVIGLGGLGHMGIQFAHAMGAKVVMITTSESKGRDAKLLGADEVLLSKDEAAMKSWAGTFDFLLNTIPVGHDINPYMALLKVDATMCVVGAIDPLTTGLNTGTMVFSRRSIAGSLIGGLKETQEMLDFCADHAIGAKVEVIPSGEINTAYTRMQNNDIKYRFVIDLNAK